MSRAARQSQGRIDTLIGAGVRIEGNMKFTGVLLIQGDTLGDVSCDSDSAGTVVVSKTGSVTGCLNAPYIIVGGHVSGPLRSSVSIEIQQGACVLGDTFYKTIDIRAGGVIQGSLNPAFSMQNDFPDQEPRAPFSESPAIKAADRLWDNPLPNGSRPWDRLGVESKLGGAVALLIAAAALILLNRNPSSDALPASPMPPIADAVHKEVSPAQAAPAASGEAQGAERTAAGDTPLTSNSAADPKTLGQTPPADQAEIYAEKVVAVQGVNPVKPASIFLVMSKEPAVLYRKKRQDLADGTRIDVSRSAAESISIARNDIFRVAKGRNLTIFYQGTKVAPRTIESGAWMSFVPQAPDAEGERK